MLPAARSMLLALLAMGCQACFSLVGDVQAGVVSSTTLASGRTGATFNASLGGNADTHDRSVEHYGPGLALRTKFTGDVQQVALSPHFYLLPGSFVTPYARGGVNLLQFENVDDEFGYGMFSPYAEAGMFLGIFVLSTFVEYDLRFTPQPHEGFFGLQLGIGTGLSTASL